MIVNGKALLEKAPIVDMLPTKERAHGVSHGLTEAGYDIRIKQGLRFIERSYPSGRFREVHSLESDDIWTYEKSGRFCIASSVEEFEMPDDLVGVVHDKSTWARRGLSVFNTVIEPGWRGFLTLELVYHEEGELIIPPGAGIAQVLFTRIENTAAYEGKYQDQPNRPISARES